MDEKKKFLLVMGVPSIKKYVFGTDRLIEITGASALLDDLNRMKTEAELRGQLNGAEVDPIYANGGAAQFIVETTEEELEKAIHHLEGYFHTETRGGVRIVCGRAAYDGKNYPAALQAAVVDSEAAGAEKPFEACSTVHTGFLCECKSCSEIAAKRQVFGNKELVLCDTCFRKATYGRAAKEKATGLWHNFAEYLSKHGIETQRPKSFEDIAKAGKAPRDYTALVYADGNGMGKLIREIGSPDEYRFFSQTVDNAIRESCHEALHEVFWTDIGETWPTLPAEILMVGGDDLMVYLSADRAFPFAIKAGEKFTDKTMAAFASSTYDLFRKRLNGEGVSISLGIAIGKEHTPFSILLAQAQDLLKTAKREGSKKYPVVLSPPTFIDYHFTSFYNQISVEASRSDHLEFRRPNQIKLYRKPYSLPEMKDMLSDVKQLLKSRIPRTRLKRLGYAPALGKMNGTLECLKLFMRADKDTRPLIRKALDRFDCFKNMPWNENDPENVWTMLPDLVELADLIKERENL